MDDPQADAMGGGAERGYGEQCADTDGLAQAIYGEGWLGDASARDQHRANTNGLAAADTLEALLTKHLRIAEERLAHFMRNVDATRQPLSAGWHHLACVTTTQPKPMPARALRFGVLAP